MMLAALMLAQTASQCLATDAALPASLAGWNANEQGLTLGRGGTIDVTTGAAHADFRIEAPGTYGIVLDRTGWIDVSPTGASAPLKSVKHGHGPDCSSIKKIVRFALQPGAYRLALRNLKLAKAKVMLVRD